MPAALTYNLATDRLNWFYHTEPQRHLAGRALYWPRGRVWGGSSSLNAMVYVRGHALDYDRWETEGAAGWAYRHCLPYFRRAQQHEAGPDAYRGGAGPLHVTRGRSRNPLHEAFLTAGQQAGYPLTEDMNGFRQEGVGRMDMTVHRGMRWSAAQAYLHPALGRPGLETRTGALATRVLLEGGRAVGVEWLEGGRLLQARAEEVVLCGGAINSPQLLQLSGIGPADVLREAGIQPVHHMPGVGANLQDHLEVYLVQRCRQPVSLYSQQRGLARLRIGLQWFLTQSGDCATTHLESGAFLRTSAEVTHPDIQIHFFPAQVKDHGRTPPDIEAYQAHVGPMRATSKGTVLVRSADPRAAPAIDPNYLATEQDRWEMRQGVRLAREIFAQSSFDSYRGEEVAPGSEAQSDAALDAYIEAHSDTDYHPSCTCRMGDGADPEAVVDAQGRVLGVEGLRVVDASIMPSIISGNLNAPVIMMAEKLADVIRDHKPLTPEPEVPVFVTDTSRQRG
jgi:choline dehydrogenase